MTYDFAVCYARSVTRKQKAELRISELRQKLNELAAKDSLTADESAEVEKLEGELRAGEAEYRASIREEAEQAAQTEADPQLTALEGRVELRRYLSAALDDAQFDGAELEYQQACELSGREIPLAAIAPLPEVESRADATTDAPNTVGQNQRMVLQRIFARSAAMWLGVRFDQVPAGLPVYPVITAGATPQTLAAGAEHPDITAGTIAGYSLSPGREQVMYSYQVEDQAKFGASLESALRMDMSGAMAEHMDRQILTRSGTGFLTELTDPTNPTDVVTYTGFVGDVGRLVDGRHAYTTKDVRLLVGPGTYGILGAILANNTSVSAAGWAGRETAGMRTSAHIPAPASDIQKAIAALAKGGNAVAAMWPGVSLIVDRVTNKKSGRVDLSMVSLWDFKIIREDGYKLLEFKLA